jgi:peroxiredoxin
MQKDVVDRFKGKDFQLLAISRGEKKATVDQFRDKQGYTFPMGLDPKQEIYNKYASNYIPRNFVVGKDGKVIYVSVGYEPAEFENMLKAIEAAL